MISPITARHTRASQRALRDPQVGADSNDDHPCSGPQVGNEPENALRATARGSPWNGARPGERIDQRPHRSTHRKDEALPTRPLHRDSWEVDHGKFPEKVASTTCWERWRNSGRSLLDQAWRLKDADPVARASTSLARMCDEENTVHLPRRASPTVSRNAASISGSRVPLVGSSRIRSSGRVAKAAISWIFCRLPLVVPDAFVRLKMESLDQHLSGIVDRTVRPAEELEALPAGQREASWLTGHIGERPMHRTDCHAPTPKSAAVPDVARCEGRAAAGSSSSSRHRWTREAPLHLPRGNGEIQRVQRDGRSVSLRKTAGADRCRGGTGGGHRVDHAVPVGLRPGSATPLPA